MLLKPEEMLVNGGTQPRAELTFDVMEDYAEQMRSGAKFPPITVFFDGKDYWLADGFHRIGAHLRAFNEDTPIEAEVIQGTQSDAQWYSFGVNKTHGLRRTNPDKERAVRAALSHTKSKTLSDAAIADHVGVHRNTVLRIRHEWEAESRHLHKLCKSDATTGGGDSSPPSLPESPDVEQEGRSQLSTTRNSNGTASSHNSSQTEQCSRRKGRDGRTIDTANIGRSCKRKPKKPRSAAELVEARRNGYQGSFPSLVKLTLPNNHVHNCAYGLLQHFTFEYLQKVFQEVTHIHQERLERENPQ